jgi:hypothetical protein
MALKITVISFLVSYALQNCVFVCGCLFDCFFSSHYGNLVIGITPIATICLMKA